MSINIETKQLFEAIDALDVKKFKNLLDNENVDVNFLKDSETPLTTLINYLSYAADESEKVQEMIQALYTQQQLDINARNEQGNTAAHLAGAFQLYDPLKLILQHEKMNFNMLNNSGENFIEFWKKNNASEAIEKAKELFPNEIKELESDRTSTRQNDAYVNEARDVRTATAAIMELLLSLNLDRNEARDAPSTVISDIRIEPLQNRTYPI